MKTNFDVFNGDADGICALIQLRLATPKDSVLITGVKRDIALLKQVDPAIAQDVTVLDVAMGKNRCALDNLLSEGVRVFYADHHNPDDVPDHPSLTTHINTAANTCTSLIIDKLLDGRYREWALVGAYGDNMIAVADTLGKKSGLSEQDRQKLKQFGTYLNYNGYGASLADLLFSPAEIYKLMAAYPSPFNVIAERPDIYATLENGFISDSEKAASIVPYSERTGSRVFMLPDQAWARRISGVFSNELTNRDPDTANAVITARSDGNYVVSIRSPLKNRIGADELASSFPTGGGRKAAAGINALPAELLNEFIEAFHQRYPLDT
ncbi:DHH family phosphoesterase [Enterovibrio nigricans]|uniref:Single-stranded DNA-specific exonuclease, DHH superfamily, may be involved in DNA replication intiation n=1 Tax=Enterovibrio nigricans DSM 22720 TaxID=1121868 RepID=A0A1T4TVR9_9GAMM|nr:DHHA1 domain-containing protein [Enterovibrio nigricans]PKF50690.1 acetyltransferase [Enterovibrio nigricans]SKA44524.1 Single-stranded DNA-specific exonuclease, DHH superfamily, may be involved in DNA replication intiation [Enterovibrio nigricans DSM 22720]